MRWWIIGLVLGLAFFAGCKALQQVASEENVAAVQQTLVEAQAVVDAIAAKLPAPLDDVAKTGSLIIGGIGALLGIIQTIRRAIAAKNATAFAAALLSTTTGIERVLDSLPDELAAPATDLLRDAQEDSGTRATVQKVRGKI